MSDLSILEMLTSSYRAGWQRFPLQPYLHWQGASPCCTATPHEFPSRIPGFELGITNMSTVCARKATKQRLTLNDSINRASLLAEATVNALGHVDI